MGGIAFVFSGQGDQYPGMGREMAEKYPGGAGGGEPPGPIQEQYSNRKAVKE